MRFNSVLKSTNRDIDLNNEANNAVAILLRHYRHGAYRVIRDPEGVVSLWAIESSPNAPFSISFVDKGRVYNKVEDVPDHLLRAFIDYVRKAAR